jgi:4-hydroxy-tetrahydrodipicolinate synthase
MSEPKRIRGVLAALLLPRDDEGRPAWQDFERNAEFTLHAGVEGLCVNGATGEFAGATQQERKEAVTRARRIAGPSGLVLSGVGSTIWTRVLALARDAEEAGADALLVPAPHFFQYEPGDLAEFYRRIAAKVRVPALIYNLPAFTGGLEADLAERLIREEKGIAGVKDSSGKLDLLERLAAHDGKESVRLVGNDAVLGEALRAGICDGVISGVAGAVPEITLALWRSAQAHEWDLFSRLESRLRGLLEKLDAFPTPWGLKIIAALRGLGRASFALPLSAERQAQVEAFRLWFPTWWSEVESDLAQALHAESNPRLV